MRSHLSKNFSGGNVKRLWPRGKTWQITGRIYFWQKYEALDESIVWSLEDQEIVESLVLNLKGKMSLVIWEDNIS
jgi:hypothetical protein